MSAINTNSIDVNFPYPKTNNSSQGFRDNFLSVKTNLNTAGTELSELQEKAVLKNGVVGGTVDNDMKNNEIKNALTLGFRQTTFNLGSSLTGTVNIDITKGDVQYGTITGDVTLKFSKWAPNETQSSVKVFLTISNPSAMYKIYFQENVTDGTDTLEQYTGNGVGGYVTVPVGVDELAYNFTTINCGTDIEVQPLNRPRIDYDNLLPGGVTTNVQFNNNKLFDGSDNFTINTGTAQVTVGGNVLPKVTDTYSIGSTISYWKDLYLSGSTIYINKSKIQSQALGYLDLSENKSLRLPLGDPPETGNPGDKFGLIKISYPYIYVCTADYDGSSKIWKRAFLTMM